MFQVQVTLTSDAGYKPVSCIINTESKEYFLAHKKEIQEQGIIKICQKRYWQKHHVKQYGYNRVKMREYDKEKIEKLNKERYEQIKIERGWKKQEGQ